MSFYGTIYRKSFYPFYESIIKKRKTLDLLEKMEQQQWLSLDEIRKIQWDKFQHMINHAYTNVPFYKKRFKDNNITPNDIQSPNDVKKIPILTKSDIRTSGDSLLALNRIDKRFYKSSTGGSTGEPVHFGYDHASYEYRIAAAARADRWAGWDFGEKEFYLWGIPLKKEPLSVRLKKKSHHFLLRRHMFNSFELNNRTIEQCITSINKIKPKVIIGYTTPLYILAKYINTNKISMHKPVGIISSAEPLFQSYRDEIENAFLTPVFNRYGAREFMQIASECEQRNGLHINSDNLLLEINNSYNDNEENKTGELIITDLNNFAMPFIRYKNGDLGRLTNAQCSCGRGLPLLESVQGRILDAIVNQDNDFLPGEFFPHFFKDFSWIKEYQVVQHENKAVQIHIVKNDSIDKKQLSYIKEKVASLLGKNILLEILFTKNIQRETSGKLRVTKSYVDMKNILG